MQEEMIVPASDTFSDHVNEKYVKEIFSDRTLDKHRPDSKSGSSWEQFANCNTYLSKIALENTENDTAADIKHLIYNSSYNSHYTQDYTCLYTHSYTQHSDRQQ